MLASKNLDSWVTTLKKITATDWFRIAAIVVLWRVLLLVLFSFSAVKMPLNPVVQLQPDFPGPLVLQSTLRWDGFYYLDIITKGYSSSPTQPYVAFFPLFPLIISLLHKLGANILVAALFVNTIATFFASYFLLMLSNNYFKNRVLAYRTVLLFLFSPAALFLAAFYTEAIFCAFVLGAIWYARQGKWLAASILTAFATATRLPGVLVLLVLLIEYLQQHEYSVKKFKWDVLFLLIAPLGILSYIIFLTIRTGDGLAFMHVTKLYWSYHQLTLNIVATVHKQAQLLFEIVQRHQFKDLAALFDNAIPFFAWLFAFVTTLWMFIKKLPLSYRVLGVASLVLFSINGNFVSDNRYLIFFFPIYLMIVELIKNETFYSLVLASSASSMAIMLAAFANNFWVG